MSVMARRLAALPLLALVWLLAGCTGAKTGKVDPNAGVNTADQIGDFLIKYGRYVGIAIVVIALGGFLRFILGSKAVQILIAITIGGAVVYFALKGGHR